MNALLDNVLRFAAFLRDAGVSLNAGRMPDVMTAMEAIGVRRRGDVRAAMRSLLIHRHEDIQLFDAGFDQLPHELCAGPANDRDAHPADIL